MILFLPSLYVLSFLPALHVWVIPIWVTLVGIATSGYLVGIALRTQRQPKGFLPTPARLLILVLALGWLVNGGWLALEIVRRQAAFAQAWDMRDAYLRTHFGTSQTVQARALETIFGADLTPDVQHWSNACIARYYNLPAILPDDQPPFVP